MTKYDIMVDVDDVLTDTIGAIHALAHSMGIHDNSVPMQTWEGHEQYGITLEEYLELWSVFTASGGFEKMEPIPGSAAAVRRLSWAGHRIHIVTARGFLSHNGLVRDQTEGWLVENAVPFETLSFAKDKVAIQEDLKVHFDYAIDDRYVTVAALRSVGTEAFLAYHDHNRFDLGSDSPWRVRDLAEFADRILA